MYIRRRDPEWRSAAVAFMRRTAAIIVTRNRSAPIMRDQISNGNGANVAARRVIIFSIGRCCSAKCALVLISRTLDTARP